jgi:hypothetical protein
MKIGNTGFNESVKNDAIEFSKASVTHGQLNADQKLELEAYRANDPQLKIHELQKRLSEAKKDNDFADSDKNLDIKSKSNENEISFFSDKLFNKSSKGLEIWKSIDGIASNTAIISNVAGGFMELMNLPQAAKEGIAKFVDLVTNFSFIPYGLDGMRKAFFENKNPYMLIGFAMELSMVWMSDLKNKYLIRGAATGTDQIWVATQHKLMDKDAERFKNGKFKSWSDGFIETPKACIAMLKDIVKNPVQALATIDKEKGTGGYYALLSSIGSFTSTVGYFLTKNEKIFGTMRDISGSLFDWEMLLDKKPQAKLSGLCFIAESVLDFTARFIEDNNTRLFVNMLSHASGRQALQLYKASNEDIEKNNDIKENPIQDKKPPKPKLEDSIEFDSYQLAA